MNSGGRNHAAHEVRLFHFDFTVVVAVVAVGVVQVAVDQVVDVVAVRDRLVTAAGAVHMVSIVAVAVVLGCATGRIGIIHFQFVLHDGAIGLLVMQMAVVQVIHMVPVFNRGVSAIGAVFVVVIGMNVF